MPHVTIKPIRNEADLIRAKSSLAKLLHDNASGKHDDDIEVLSSLIEKFEEIPFQCVKAPSPTAAIKFRMEGWINTATLKSFIGSRARVSEVLSGKRQLSIDMIRSLHEGLRIPYNSLISERPKDSNVENVSTSMLDKLNTLGFNLDRHELPSFISPSHNVYAPVALLRKTRTQRAFRRNQIQRHWRFGRPQSCKNAKPGNQILYLT